MSGFFPNGRKAALSLTFDDARVTQIDNGIALLARHDLRATFYVIPGAVEKRLEGWREAVKAGHEVGNHTLTHPCSCNFAFSRNNAIEDYTLERMEKDILDAQERVASQLNIRATTFGYPCGQFFVGRGVEQKSYVPLVAKNFLAGRGYLNEIPNDPERCDLAYLFSTGFDGLEFPRVKQFVDNAINEGRWLIFAGHEMAEEGGQTVRTKMLEELCAYVRSRESEIWTDTVHNVATHIAAKRAK